MVFLLEKIGWKKSDVPDSFYERPKKGEADAFTVETIGSVPDVVGRKLEKNMPPESRKMFRVPGMNGLETYVVMEVWEKGYKGAASKRAHALDVFRGRIIGETSFNVFGTELASTHIGTTPKEYQRKGLAERRLVLLQQLVEHEWEGESLVSSPVAFGAGEKVWQDLEKRDLVKSEAGPKGSTVYRFVPTHKDL